MDNICIQVIERHLLRNLPAMFSPETVAAYTDEELGRIAGKGESSIMKRKQASCIARKPCGGLQGPSEMR